MQENIFESRAYLSNDPNISNLREELAAVASKKARLILNDPFQDHADPSSHQFDLNDFENLNEIQESSHENFKSRYRSNYENYKSVGSINKSVRSPTQAQQQKPPKSGMGAVSIGWKKDDYPNKIGPIQPAQLPLQIDTGDHDF